MSQMRQTVNHVPWTHLVKLCPKLKVAPPEASHLLASHHRQQRQLRTCLGTSGIEKRQVTSRDPHDISCELAEKSERYFSLEAQKDSLSRLKQAKEGTHLR